MFVQRYREILFQFHKGAIKTLGMGATTLTGNEISIP